jgi:uncharacterized protein
MGTRTEYGPGTFCWVNLSSSDPDGAKRFYAQLFGWDYDDRGGDDDGTAFSMARRHEADVAAIYESDERERAAGLPPHWNNYVNVTDADAAAARAEELGGSVFDGPFDVTDAGRTAVIVDPTGAMFWVWQPGTHIGAGRVNDLGCLTWNDLSTNDPERATEFYSSLFGWTFEQMDTGDGPGYWVIGNDTSAMGRNGGMREMSPEESGAGAPPNWMPYFTVESAASAAGTAKASGGSVLMGPARLGAGTVAVVADPTGAVFSVFEGEVDD